MPILFEVDHKWENQLSDRLKLEGRKGMMGGPFRVKSKEITLYQELKVYYS